MNTRTSPPSTSTLRGRWLLLARAAWVVVAVLYLGVFISGIPSEFARLHTPCTDTISCSFIPHLTAHKAHKLHELGLSVEFFAAYFVALEVIFTIVSASIGAAIFWRASRDRMALLASLVLVTLGVVIPIPLLALELSPLWTASARAVFFVGAVALEVFFYTFPDGRFVPRWSRWILLAAMGVLAPSILFPYSYLSLWRHPLVNALVSAGLLAGPVFFVQIYRYLRVSDAAQRQQTKWVVLGMGTAGAGYGVFIALDLLLPSGLLVSLLGNTAFFALMLLIPISIAVAVLRYRLYDIDILINRTLVYTLFTAVLAAVYFGTVVLLQRLFVALTGEQSTLAVVASTLLIAALFNPLRRRIQSLIDRSFYRSKYDARKTLEAFSVKLREETNLEALSDDLVGVVRETIQPAHISLWLHPATLQKSEKSD